MNVDVGTEGLLKALQKLDHASRGHVLEHQPLDVIRDVLLLLLHKEDAASAPAETPLAHAPLFPTQGVPTENLGTRIKRSNSAATPDPTKRTRTDAAPLQENRMSLAQVVVKKEHKIIDLLSDTEEPEAEARDNPENMTVPHPPDLPLYFQVRTELGQDTLKALNDLPARVQIELRRRFEFMWSAHTTRTNKYTSLTSRVETYTENAKCIRNMILVGTWDSDNRWSKGGEPRKTADDRCIKAREACGYFAKHDDQHIIVFVPLPEALRQGKNWTELSYWVRTGSK